MKLHPATAAARELPRRTSAAVPSSASAWYIW